MITTKEIYDIINEISPFSLALDYDNSGILYDAKVGGNLVLFSLDITNAVIKEAVSLNCKHIVSHHPVMFGGVKAISYNTPIANAIKNDISLVVAHTNYDRARPGSSDILFDLLELDNRTEIYDGLARFGIYKTPLTVAEFTGKLKSLFPDQMITLVEGHRDISKVAVAAGACGEIFEVLDDDVDAVVTGEAKYHISLEAQDRGCLLAVVGHYSSEIVGFTAFMDKVKARIGHKADCRMVTSSADPYKYV
ncbi:MAG: Nif3-like dinuclear metal center hexameric protein [Oscillospiraceae bacterium]|nr:Nif3-like dinuclear metal center hexameric protein [Oscillospiraceae bacterium]